MAFRLYEKRERERENRMKILFVSGDPFAATEFENKYKGKKIEDLTLVDESIQEYNYDPTKVVYKTLEFNTIEEFLRYISTPDNGFWLDNETIGSAQPDCVENEILISPITETTTFVV